MNRVSEATLGLHDFRAFCRRPTNSDADEPLLRRVIHARWERLADEWALTPDQSPTLKFTIRAESFCHHMVRCLASTCRRRLPRADWHWSPWATKRMANPLVRLSRVTTQPMTSGFDLADLSGTVRPQDDLYQYVNSEWIERTTMPEDKARYGTFDLLADGAELAIRAILDEARTAPEGGESRKVGDLYSSFLDEERINARGVRPLIDRLAQVEALASIDELLALIGRLQRRGVGGFYAVFVDNDPGDPERYVVLLEQSGLSLPDESYYREEHFAPIRDAFVAHVQRMLELAGVSDAAARARRIFELETRIAAGHWNNVDSRDSEKTYNLKQWSEASQLFGDVRLEVWHNALEAPVGSFDDVVLRQPSFASAVGALFTDSNLEVWKDWLSWQIIAGDAPFLSPEFVDEHFDFYGRTLTGDDLPRQPVLPDFKVGVREESADGARETWLAKDHVVERSNGRLQSVVPDLEAHVAKKL